MCIRMPIMQTSKRYTFFFSPHFFKWSRDGQLALSELRARPNKITCVLPRHLLLQHFYYVFLHRPSVNSHIKIVQRTVRLFKQIGKHLEMRMSFSLAMKQMFAFIASLEFSFLYFRFVLNSIKQECAVHTVLESLPTTRQQQQTADVFIIIKLLCIWPRDGAKIELH